MTDAERQRRLVERRKAQGLVLKRVWVPPMAWPAIRDLATQEAEEFVFAESYTTETAAQHDTAYAYEFARDIWGEIKVQALATQSDPHGFCLRVLRAMIKTAPEPFSPTEEQISKAKALVFGEEE